MKIHSRCVVVAVLAMVCSGAFAQTANTPAAKRRTSSQRSSKPTPPAITQQDLQSLRDAIQQQQQQIQQLRDELSRRDQEVQQVQQQLQRTQSTASQAKSAADSVQSSTAQQSETVTRLSSDMKDVQSTLTSNALNTQDEQKKFSTLEGVLGRFRFNGDVRVRQEDFFQSLSGCTSGQCAPRFRERIRLRFGVDSRLNDDFTAGIYVASGIITDPTSTNETLTGAFERKNISFDRGFITYNPKAHKWLSLTGGKFAYTWTRTNNTFDPDLNPEGFSEKISYDTKNAGPIKNLTLTGMQLLFNELNRPGSPLFSGADSFAAGAQLSTKVQFGKFWTLTPSYTFLNWRNEDALLAGFTSVLGGIPGTAVNSFPNGLTNATTTANGRTVFASRFQYSDLIIDNMFDVGLKNFPVRLVGEYLDNLRAASNASHLYLGDLSIGQQKAKGDWLFGYSFWRQEQDSVIAAFNESDQRAPTNIIQHKTYINYRVRNNVTLAYTGWFGRTLNTSLQNAVRLSGIAAGQREPYLKRLQFDVIYNF